MEILDKNKMKGLQMKTRNFEKMLLCIIVSVVFLPGTNVFAMYEPQLMRFTSRDPKRGSSEEPLTLHRYLYTGNDPINWTDPTGKSALNIMNGLTEATTVYSVGLTIATIGASDLNFGLLAIGGYLQQATGLAFVLGSVCFTGDTEVLTACGEMPIEQIQPGWYVWAADPNTGKSGLFKVSKCFKRETDKLVIIDAGGEKIECTPEHPFYVYDSGWCWAKDLEVGTKLVDVNNNPVEVNKIEFINNPAIVYNIEIDGSHTYYVSNTKVLVHNICGVPHSAEIRALNDMLKADLRGGKGLSLDNAKAYLELADEMGLVTFDHTTGAAADAWIKGAHVTIKGIGEVGRHIPVW
jgi:hypothetical protein